MTQIVDGPSATLIAPCPPFPRNPPPSPVLTQDIGNGGQFGPVDPRGQLVELVQVSTINGSGFSREPIEHGTDINLDSLVSPVLRLGSDVLLSNRANLPPARGQYNGNEAWLPMRIICCDGGEYSHQYPLQNLLRDNTDVYCSFKRQYVNLILAFDPQLTGARAPPFKIDEVLIRVPERNFTSPLRNGFLFVCSEFVDLRAFDVYDEVDYKHLLDRDAHLNKSTLPMAPACVRTMLYFQLDPSTNVFRYKFKNPIKSARYLFFKFIGSFGSHDNIDVEFVGICGQHGLTSFPNGDLM